MSDRKTNTALKRKKRPPVVNQYKEYGRALEKRSDELITALQKKNFDVIDELLTLYSRGELKDKEKLNLLLELMPYVYPKLKMIDTDENKGQNVPSLVQVIYTDKQIQQNTDKDDSNNIQ